MYFCICMSLKLSLTPFLNPNRNASWPFCSFTLAIFIWIIKKTGVWNSSCPERSLILQQNQSWQQSAIISEGSWRACWRWKSLFSPSYKLSPHHKTLLNYVFWQGLSQFGLFQRDGKHFCITGGCPASTWSENHTWAGVSLWLGTTHHYAWGPWGTFASGRATCKNNPYWLRELLKALCCQNSGCLEEREAGSRSHGWYWSGRRTENGWP